jgi:hypothetical protein
MATIGDTTGTAEYYVYVYIDPRNFEEFYYGKGKGNRKESHLDDESDSEKSRRIAAIKKAGLDPIIKVIAKDLTEREAFLVEKTLIWKLGRTLTNKSSGQFADKFRPQYTLHQELAKFDFKNGIYYVNVGEGKHRCWADCRKYGFLAAGQGKQWSEPMKSFEKGDIVAAYLRRHGFVGIGRVTETAVRVGDFKYEGKSLHEVPLAELNIFENADNDNCEYLVKIKWIKDVDKKDAKWKRKAGLFTTQRIKASLQGQPKTREFLEHQFNFKFQDLVQS